MTDHVFSASSELRVARKQIDVVSAICKAERAIEIVVLPPSLNQPFGLEVLEVGQVAWRREAKRV